MASNGSISGVAVVSGAGVQIVRSTGSISGAASVGAVSKTIVYVTEPDRILTLGAELRIVQAV